MTTKFIPMEYKEVVMYNGTEKGLYKWVQFMTTFNRFYAICIFCSLIYAAFSLFYWDIFKSIFWDVIFTFILILIFCSLIWAIKKEKTFKTFQRIRMYRFQMIECVENEDGFFVEAYDVKDRVQNKVYRFYFEKSFDFTSDMFVLYRVALDGCKAFYFCEK